MSILIIVGATAALAFPLGAAATQPRMRRLHRELAAAVHQAQHDPLTGLPNRAYAADLFTHYATAARAMTITLIDLDDFKTVNDTHGHDAGDHLLIAVARRLSTTAAHHSGVAARLAGDEFLLLLPADGPDHIHSSAAALVALASPVATTGGTSTLIPHASAGVTFFNGLDGGFVELLRQADTALYHAKQRRDRIAVYQPGMQMPPPQPRRRRLRDHRRATRRSLTRQREQA